MIELIFHPKVVLISVVPENFLVLEVLRLVSAYHNINLTTLSSLRKLLAQVVMLLTNILMVLGLNLSQDTQMKNDVIRKPVICLGHPLP
jgi:hypothetical protein